MVMPWQEQEMIILAAPVLYWTEYTIPLFPFPSVEVPDLSCASSSQSMQSIDCGSTCTTLVIFQTSPPALMDVQACRGVVASHRPEWFHILARSREPPCSPCPTYSPRNIRLYGIVSKFIATKHFVNDESDRVATRRAKRLRTGRFGNGNTSLLLKYLLETEIVDACTKPRRTRASNKPLPLECHDNNDSNNATTTFRPPSSKLG